MSNDLPNSIFDKIVNLFREAVKQLPALKYSWGFIAIICILALIDFFNLGNFEVVFRSAVLALGIIFLIFIFSLLTKTNDKVIRSGLYILIYSIILTVTALVIGFAIHTLTPLKFPFYENLLNASGTAKNGDSTLNKKDTSVSRPKDTTTNQDNEQMKKKDTPLPNQTERQSPVLPSPVTPNVGIKKKPEDENVQKPKEPTAIEMCTARCLTKGIIGVEISFTDPKNNNKYYKAVSDGGDLEFEVPCYLLEQSILVTFKKGNQKSESRNVQKLKGFEIPDLFK